ncbi:MAG TPA: pantoate--beta-alanine ligase [Candidatus Saccharimonadales bacterium]|nr:pantoate--beta-alanine ligase [Candidatus Saccharimonadales bacterium]
MTSLAAMQQLAQQWRRRGIRIGLVPTMGYLHEGHLSLVARARRCVGPRGRVVVSVFVNPTQFGPREDLSRYPRDLPRDRRLCQAAGVDVIFLPRAQAMYPADAGRGFSTWVVEERLSRGMEGGSRPLHFRGVTTVVAKLFNLVQPEVAVFGSKDYQQAAIVQRMVRDLNFPLKVIVAPTRRTDAGLALSSRNKYLDADQRRQALVLVQALRQARERIRQSRMALPARRLKAELKRNIERAPEARVDYIEFFHPATLQPEARARRGTHMALAVYVGGTRLIDNGRL